MLAIHFCGPIHSGLGGLFCWILRGIGPAPPGPPQPPGHAGWNSGIRLAGLSAASLAALYAGQGNGFEVFAAGIGVLNSHLQ